MAKTWDNVPCRFWTKNTVNKRGNSEYRVFTNRMIRHAPVNVDRDGAKDQVFTFKRRAICYLDPGSQLLRLIMRTLDDNQVKIDSVAGDSIWVQVGRVVREASRRPQVGLATFDFVNNNGDLSGIHVGHQIDKLVEL